MAGRLEGKVAVIIGAGSSAPGVSIGRACAITFAREGAKIFAFDISDEALEGTREMVLAEGGEIECVVGDGGDEDAIKRAVAACVVRFGKISILMNNIGITVPGGVTTTSLESWESTLRVNLTSAFLAAKYVLPVMLEHGSGSIVSVSTLNSQRERRLLQYPSYSASKAALNALTRSIAMENAALGIRANNLILGPIATPQIAAAYVKVREEYGDERADHLLEVRKNMTPMRREGTPWEVANAALFLASDESSFTTGSDIWVDGGQGFIGD